MSDDNLSTRGGAKPTITWEDIQRVAQALCDTLVAIHYAEACLNTAIYTGQTEVAGHIQRDISHWQHAAHISDDALGLFLEEPCDRGNEHYNTVDLAVKTYSLSLPRSRRPNLAQYERRRSQVTDRYRYGIYGDWD